MHTISDIAKIAGVSKTTVSRVLNDEKYVSDKLRQRVKKIADELGYIPNGNAISLSTGKTYTLGVLLPAYDNCYDELLNSILLNAKEKDYHVMVLPSYYEFITEKTYYEMFRRKVIDGLILASINAPENIIIDLQKYGKIVSAEKLDNRDITMIYPDRTAAYKTLFGHLKTLGKKRTMFTLERSPEVSKSSLNKIKSFQNYFTEPIENKDFFIGIKSFNDGYQLGKHLAKSKNVPEIIYTSGDQIAAGVIKAFNENKIKHGEDYQIIGEGNTPYSQTLNFSSIDFRLTEIGELLVTHIISDVEQESKSFTPNILFRGHLE